MDIPLAQALLLWDDASVGCPRFMVRPLGHTDYYAYEFQAGACMRTWQELAERDLDKLKLKAMIDIWHVVAFYGVPAQMVHEAMLCIPEYRDMLADDCLPDQFRHERD